MSVDAQATVLIVDDAPENLMVLSSLLSPQYRVLVANSGARALQLARAAPPPDLVLLDVMMPGMDGYQVFAALRASSVTQQLPVIFVTGMDSAEDQLKGLDAGAVDYIVKPIVPALLLARVRVQLELKAARDQLHRQNAQLVGEVVGRTAESQLAQVRLHESDRRFRDMLDNLALASVMLDRDARITYANSYLLTLTGWRLDDVLGKNWFEKFMTPGLGDMTPFFQSLLDRGPGAWHRDNQILTRTGQYRLMRWNNTVLRGPDGRAVGTASIGEDITERHEAEVKITRLNRVYAVLSGINALIVRARARDELYRDACRIAVKVGKFRLAWIGVVEGGALSVAALESEGAKADFLLTSRKRLSLADDSPDGNSLTLRAIRAKRAMFINDLRSDPHIAFRDELLRLGVRGMATLPLLVEADVVAVMGLYAVEENFFDAQEVELLGGLAGDISFALAHIANTERLNYLAYYDDITGLPNRALFLDRVGHQLRGLRPGGLGALALVDIERFHVINDTLGRAAGDELLRAVAQRMQASGLRVDTLARVGVNCFGLALQEPRDAGDAALTLDQMLQVAFAKPFALQGTELRIAAKAGMALYPSDGADADALLQAAGAALKRVKASVETAMFYSPEMNTRVAQALNLESKLRTALALGQFVLHYQPKVALAGGQVSGAEALIRWNDPDSGLVPPAQFIPVLEETGLIYEVGRWALRQAVQDHLRWRAEGFAPLRIAVNVSPLQLRHRGFLDDIRQVVAGNPLAADGLELEITESQIMHDMQRNIENLQALRALGIRIAIDDFGTGYSSLGHLARLPVDTLKIDRSFVLDMVAGPQGLALVSTIINLAQSLRLLVVAEGVETEAQRSQLQALGCDQMQGYLFSKPVPVQEFEQLFLVPSQA